MMRRGDGILCLMDNVLVYGKLAADHDDQLDKMLRTMEKAGMILNKEKC